MRIKKRFITLIIVAFLLGLALFPSGDPAPIHYVDRQSSETKIEKVAGEGWLAWLYNNPVGEMSLQALVKRKFFSEWYGRRMDAPGSVDKIEPFAEEYDIDLSIAQKQEFTSFNDFFTRKLKPDARPVNMDSSVVVSPADGKVLAYEDVSEQDFIVKGYRFNLFDFLQDSLLAQKYEHGSLMIFRLCPADYHRFHFPLSGEVSDLKKISGDYYSVNPIAIHKMIEIFCENKREYVIVSSPEFGPVIMAEVGATMVGSIIQTYEGNLAIKGEEKGYFKFGGSTVILLFEASRIKIDTDLLENTQKQLETSVLMGEQVGVRNPAKFQIGFSLETE